MLGVPDVEPEADGLPPQGHAGVLSVVIEGQITFERIGCSGPTACCGLGAVTETADRRHANLRFSRILSYFGEFLQGAVLRRRVWAGKMGGYNTVRAKCPAGALWRSCFG